MADTGASATVETSRAPVAAQLGQLVKLQILTDISDSQQRTVTELDSAKKALTRFDRQSRSRISEVSAEIEQNAVLLKGVAIDLQYIFTRCRSMRQKLEVKHRGLVQGEQLLQELPVEQASEKS